MTSQRKKLLKKAKPLVICLGTGCCIVSVEHCVHSRPHNQAKLCKRSFRLGRPFLPCRSCTPLNLLVVIRGEQPA